MSRVRSNQKWMNTSHYDKHIYEISKKVRIHSENEDYQKARTLSQWLFVKYDMSYKTYKNKSKNRKQELRNEFANDTGIHIDTRTNQN